MAPHTPTDARARSITLAHFSLRNARFSERCAAASYAGFDGVGLYVPRYVAAVDRHHGDADLVADQICAQLSAGGVRITELEALRFFDDEMLAHFVDAAHRFGAERVQTIAPFTGAVDRAAAAAWLRHAADLLAPTRLAIEFLPPTDVPDAAAAVEIVERAGHPGVGLCVDSWHVFRGAGLTSLHDLDPAHVVSIQLDDGPLQPVLDDYIQDCLHHREVLGRGEFDLARFMELLPPEAPLSIEVIDDDLDELTANEAADLLMRSTRVLLGG